MVTLESQAKNYFKNQKMVSYDETTRLIVRNIDWSEQLDFTSEYKEITTMSKSLQRLDYYYEQILKEVSMVGETDLQHGKYIDFWQLLEKMNIKRYFLRYEGIVLNDLNLFSFLSTVKQRMKELQFINTFKLKSLEMLEVKKGFNNV